MDSQLSQRVDSCSATDWSLFRFLNLFTAKLTTASSEQVSQFVTKSSIGCEHQSTSEQRCDTNTFQLFNRKNEKPRKLPDWHNVLSRAGRR